MNRDKLVKELNEFCGNTICNKCELESLCTGKDFHTYTDEELKKLYVTAYREQNEMNRDKMIKELNDYCDLCDGVPLQINNWIPTSKRLPNADGRYLVQTEHGDMRDAEFYKDFGENGEFGYYSDYYVTNLIGYIDYEWTPYDVVAWMPLPTPYEEDEEEETDDKIQQILNRLEGMKSKPMELVYDVGLIRSIIDVVREVGKE